MAPRNQQWMILYEESSKTDFTLDKKTFDEIATVGFSLGSMLSFIGRGDQNPNDYNFFIFSDSMKAAVQLLNDKSVFITYRLYCEDDDVVTIIVRPATDPSPNSSQCPSAPESLRQRRKLSGKHNLQNVFVRPVVPKETKNLDAETLLPISQLPEDQKVVLDLGRGQFETFSASYLLGRIPLLASLIVWLILIVVGWIMAEVDKGTPLDNIVVTSITPKGRPSNIKLDKDVWTRSLLRGPTKDQFLGIWNTFSELAVGKTDALNSITQQFPYFENNVKIFIQDLKFFGSKVEARTRLLGTNHVFFLGQPYFSSAAVEKILALPMPPSTLQGHLDDLVKKKAERGQEQEFCAAHDLAPIFLRAFDMNWDALKREKLTLQRTKDALRRRSTMDSLSQAFSKLTPKGHGGERKKVIGGEWLSGFRFESHNRWSRLEI
ncbi:hypothetical protein CFD26_102458 [Aspergillus turcosus]|uniref:Uncharacterized protein n=1 Tax=Aspergillus turcosus TaxID=1245748 RepID=A0A3R7J068_9EURO|nr:hypothetical protein CFD26_102458 [Aspergillus turcosus]